MPYTPDEFRAQHLEGCRLDPDHAGACLLARPFRIRPEGGREYVDEHEVDEVPLLDSTDAAVREVRWIAREARALATVDDPARRTRFLARKRALLAYIEATTGGAP